jgi:F-type H+-transporting ATPase subunit a
VRLFRVICAIACLSALCFAQDGAVQSSPQDVGHVEDAPQRTMDMPNGEFFHQQFAHMNPQVWPASSEEPHLTSFYNVNLFQLIAIALILVIFLAVRRSFSSPTAPWVIRVFRGWVHWLRDEVICSLMGKEEGEKWAPLFLYVFFFIAFMNLLGLVPGGVTATACVFVTGAMAMVTFSIMLIGGMIKQGVFAYWKNLVPSGLPVILLPLMVVVELVGLVVKPFALMVRLFANMLAGHLLIYSFIGMIFVFAKMMSMSVVGSWATAIPTIGMAVFIMIIESFVVLLQAYIFVYLSVLFVQQSFHPDH